MRDAVVLVPALDEERALPGLLAALPPGTRVIVCDNGSTDRTAEVARAAGAEVVYEPQRGYGAAVRAGLSALAADPPAFVVVLDADHADDPRLLHELLRPLREGRADLVLARREPHREPGSLAMAQLLGNALAIEGLRRIVGHRYHDLGPFRALRWDALVRLDLQDTTWGINVEMQLRAVRVGLRVVEVPLPYRRRREGQSKISGTLIGTIRAGYRIVATLLRHAAP